MVALLVSDRGVWSRGDAIREGEREKETASDWRKRREISSFDEFFIFVLEKLIQSYSFSWGNSKRIVCLI